MLAAKHVYIMGLRSSAPLAEFFWYYLNYIIDHASLVVASISDIFGQLMHATEGDLVIGISFPRYTSRTVDGVSFAKKNGAKIIGITDNEQSPLARISDECLFINTDMNLFVDTLVGPMSVINALVLLIGMRQERRFAQQL